MTTVAAAPVQRRAPWSTSRSATLAVVVGGALRTFWAVIATRTPQGTFNDAFEYLRMAGDLGHGHLPTVNGAPSAFYAPGYPLLLAPILRVTGPLGITPAQAASAVNVVAGTLTIALVAWLARRWIGDRAASPAAWIVALAPSQVFWVPTAHGETVFAALIVGMVCWMTVIVDRSGAEAAAIPTRSLVAFGVAAEVALLVRGPGMLLVLVPALTLRGRGASWRSTVRPTVVVALALGVAALPWTLVNGLHAGVWNPTSTQNATVVCLGHHDDAEGTNPPPETMTRRMAVDCYQYSVFDDPALDLAPDWWVYRGVDENRWYRTSMQRGLRWMATHPLEEVRLLGQKVVKGMLSDWDAVDAGRNFEQSGWTGRADGPLHVLVNVALYVLELLVVLGLVLSERCRRAWPVWGMAALVTLTMLLTLAEPHFKHGAVPFAAVIAGGGVAALQGRRAGAVAPAG